MSHMTSYALRICGSHLSYGSSDPIPTRSNESWVVPITKFRPKAFSKFCFWCSGTACHLQRVSAFSTLKIYILYIFMHTFSMYCIYLYILKYSPVGFHSGFPKHVWGSCKGSADRWMALCCSSWHGFGYSPQRMQHLTPRRKIKLNTSQSASVCGAASAVACVY